MFNFSIIIPHKNIPSLLKRCLGSIPNRPDLEIIVIDDNSNEESIKELKTVSRDNLQIVYTKEGKGAGFARNIGIGKAKGKWILFADSDDFYEKEFNNFLSNYKDSNADVIYFNAQSNGYPHNRVAHLNYFIDLHNKDLERSEFLLKYAFGEPWCKMVKRSLINNESIFFEEVPIHNDTQYSYLVGFFAKKIHVDSRVLYTTTNQPKSLSKQSSRKIILTRACVFAKKNAFLRKKHINFFDNLLIDVFFDCYVQKKFLLLIPCMAIIIYYRISPKLILSEIFNRIHLIKSHLEIPAYPK